MSLHQLRALIYGSLAATDLVSPNRVLNCLWIGGKPPVLTHDQFESLVGNTMALWNDLATLPDAAPYPLISISAPISVEDVVQYACVRQEEILFLMRGLDLGVTDLTGLTPRAFRALEAISRASGLLKQLIRIAENQPAPGSTTLSSIANQLLDLDKVIATEMAVVLVEQKRFRLAKLDHRDPPKEPGRNTPCPCGSGRKHKQCCGKR